MPAGSDLGFDATSFHRSTVHLNKNKDDINDVDKRDCKLPENQSTLPNGPLWDHAQTAEVRGVVRECSFFKKVKKEEKWHLGIRFRCRKGRKHYVTVR